MAGGAEPQGQEVGLEIAQHLTRLAHDSREWAGQLVRPVGLGRPTLEQTAVVLLQNQAAMLHALAVLVASAELQGLRLQALEQPGPRGAT